MAVEGVVMLERLLVWLAVVGSVVVIVASVVTLVLLVIGARTGC